MKKELSIETIERGLKDEDWRVRAAAMNACNGKDVIVVAEIPNDAQVRGQVEWQVSL